MLRLAGREVRVPFDAVRGDGEHPPFARGAFREVVLLGNALGFAGRGAPAFLARARDLLAPGGRLILEVVAGPGEHALYLARLPTSTLARLLRAPVRALRPRIEGEGYAAEPIRRADPGPFYRFGSQELTQSLVDLGVRIEEMLAVAPLLGALPDRLETVGRDPVAWSHLLELEELAGRETPRIGAAAAVLVSGSV